MDVPRKLALRVGALVGVALAVGFAFMLVLGSEGMFFSSKKIFHVAYPDVAGLREGADVRLGGRAVGDVSEIHFGPAAGATHESLIVTIRVRSGYADRVRADSVARISSQGLLGDKLIEITLGSPGVPAVESGGWIVGEPPSDPARLITAATGAAEHARAILARVDDATKNLNAAKTAEELEKTLSAVRRIAERVENGPGTAHELIYDEALAAGTRKALTAFERAAGQGEQLMASARRSVANVEKATEAIDPAKIKQATDDVAAIVAEVRAGRGTLGGLIADPTLYEETKRILVNIRRNRVLKAVSRAVISDSMPEELMDAGPPPEVTPRHAPPVAGEAPAAAEDVRARSPGTQTR